MTDEKYQPVTLVHPGFAPAVLSTELGQGKPSRFPPMQASSAEEEAELRAKGYGRPGEATPKPLAHLEYPKMLRHPQYRLAVPDETQARRTETGIETYTVKGTPAAYPDVQVEDAEDEALWLARGYAPAGSFDPQTYDRLTNAALPDGYSKAEFPRWENGKLIDDPNRPVAENEYPKWLHPDGAPSERSVLVSTREEEMLLRGRLPLLLCDPPGPELMPPAATAAPDISAEEWAEFVAWKRAQPSAASAELEAAGMPDPAERDTLLKLATETGVKVDRRWSTERLREAVGL